MYGNVLQNFKPDGLAKHAVHVLFDNYSYIFTDIQYNLDLFVLKAGI